MFKKKQKQSTKQTRHLITKVNPRSPISEQYRIIRTNIEYASVDNPIQSILITSAGPASGKSLTSANLAVAYAQQGKKVLLVDADLRKPTVHYTFRKNNLRGLSNVLIGESTLELTVEESDVKGLHILTCGPIPPNPSELLASKRMKETLAHAKEIYDFIILDTPPALVVTDARILANIVDGTVLVVRSGSTEIEGAQRTKAILEEAPSKLLGAVLNDREKTEENYQYYYGV